MTTYACASVLHVENNTQPSVFSHLVVSGFSKCRQDCTQPVSITGLSSLYVTKSHVSWFLQ